MAQRFTFFRNVRRLLAAAALAVCYAPLEAQSLYNATVVEQLGQVSVEAGGYQIPLSVGGPAVKPQQVIVTGPDGYARFQVSDGSTFEVFNNARVVFRPNLGNWKDLLDIVLGRVKTFIQHEPGKVNHNEVSSPTAVISVRGTVFDVVVEDDDGTTLVTVDEGIVQVHHRIAASNDVYLHQGDMIRVFKNQPLQAKALIDKGNLLHQAMKAAENAVYQVLLQRRIGGGIPGGGNIPASTQGDQNKNGSKGGGTPGSPPAPPGSPPPPPGGD